MSSLPAAVEQVSRRAGERADAMVAVVGRSGWRLTLDQAVRGDHLEQLALPRPCARDTPERWRSRSRDTRPRDREAGAGAMGVNSLLQLAQATRRHSQGRGALTAAGVGRHHRHVLGGAHGRTKTAPRAALSCRPWLASQGVRSRSLAANMKQTAVTKL